MQRISLLVAAIVAACVFNLVQGAPPPKKYAVVPGAVVKKNPPDHPARSIGGDFKLVEDPNGYEASEVGADGVPFVTGGACLVYQSRGDIKACTTQQQCIDAAPTGGWGYCDSTQAGVPGTCWFKEKSAPITFTPDHGYIRDDHCIKSGSDKSLIVDMANDLPVGPGRPLGNNVRMSWRISSCQGIVKGGCAKRDGVEGVDFATRWGAVLDF